MIIAVPNPLFMPWYVEPGDVLLLSGHHVNTNGMKALAVNASGLPWRNKQIRIIGPCKLEGFYPSLENRSYIRFENIYFENCGKYYWPNAHHIEVVNCDNHKLAGGEIIVFEFRPGNHHIRVAGCRGSWAGNYFYSRSRRADGNNVAHHLTMEDCTVEHIGVGAWKHKDGHPYAMQGGHDNVCRRNIMRDCGSCEYWASSNQECRDNEFDDNIIENVHKMEVTEGDGFRFGGPHEVIDGVQYPLRGWRSNNKVRRNTFRNIDGSGIFATMRDPLIHFENVIENWGRAGEHTQPILIRNPVLEDAA